MKKSNHLLSSLFTTIVVASFIMLSICANGQKQAKKLADPIPIDVMKIFAKSCMGCHSDNGNSIAESMLNFSSWEKMKAKKAIKKSNAICSAVTSEFMPPKSIRKAKPELLPTKEEIELICKWAESLKLSKPVK